MRISNIDTSLNNSQVNIDNYFDNYPMPQTTKHNKVNTLFSPKRGEENESMLSRSDHFGRFNQFNRKTKPRFEDRPREERMAGKKEVINKFKTNVKALQNFGSNPGNISLLDTTLGPEAFNKSGCLNELL